MRQVSIDLHHWNSLLRWGAASINRTPSQLKRGWRVREKRNAQERYCIHLFLVIYSIQFNLHTMFINSLLYLISFLWLHLTLFSSSIVDSKPIYTYNKSISVCPPPLSIHTHTYIKDNNDIHVTYTTFILHVIFII